MSRDHEYRLVDLNTWLLEMNDHDVDPLEVISSHNENTFGLIAKMTA